MHTNACGHLFENSGDPNYRRAIMEHCKMPVVELASGLVLKKGDKLFSPRDFYLVLENSLEKIGAAHNHVYSLHEFYPNNGSNSFRRRPSELAGVIIEEILDNSYKTLDPEERELFTRDYSAQVIKELGLLRLVLDPQEVPALVEKGIC